MSNQPPYGQGAWQQPLPGPPPGQSPPGAPGQAGPPQYGAPAPPGGHPPGGPGGPPPFWPAEGPPRYGGPPPRKSKLPAIVAVIGVVIVLAGGGVLLYFLVLGDDGDDEASGGGGGGGGSDGGDYCTLLENNYEEFRDISSGTVDPEEIENAVGIRHDLRDAAPEELADEWAQLDDPFRDLEAVLDDEGLTWSDLDEVEGPEDLPPHVRDAAETFVNDLTSVDQEAVGGAIEDHAKTTCELDVEESPSP